MCVCMCVWCGVCMVGVYVCVVCGVGGCGVGVGVFTGTYTCGRQKLTSGCLIQAILHSNFLELFIYFGQSGWPGKSRGLPVSASLMMLETSMHHQPSFYTWFCDLSSDPRAQRPALQQLSHLPGPLFNKGYKHGWCFHQRKTCGKSPICVLGSTLNRLGAALNLEIVNTE